MHDLQDLVDDVERGDSPEPSARAAAPGLWDALLADPHGPERARLLKRVKGFLAALGDEVERMENVPLERIRDMIERLGARPRIVLAGLADGRLGALAAAMLAIPALREMSGDHAPLTIRPGTAATTEATLAEGAPVRLKGWQATLPTLDSPVRALAFETSEAFAARAAFTVLAPYDAAADRTRWLTTLVDGAAVVVWATDGATPWHGHERRLWFTVPDEAAARSLLVATGRSSVPPLLQEQAGEDFSDTLAVDEALAATGLAGGAVTDDAVLRASGLPKLVAAIVAKVEALEAQTLAEARALREHLDTIPLGTAQAPQPLPPSEAAAPKAAPRRMPLPSPAKVPSLGGLLRARVEACRKAQTQGEGPLIEAVATALEALEAHLAKGEPLAADHDAMIRQCAEARERVALLGYERDARAAEEAAALLRQIATDAWTRRAPVALAS